MIRLASAKRTSSPLSALTRPLFRLITVLALIATSLSPLGTNADAAVGRNAKPIRKQVQTEKPIVIFDTDMGPDIDDAMALGMVHSYADAGVWKIGAVVLSRRSPTGSGVKFIDAVNTYYGRPNIPIGNYKGGHPEDDAGQYDWMVTTSPIASQYPSDIRPETVRHGHKVMRQVLERANDGQVIIVTTGFTNNLSGLLKSPGGKDLIRRKVKRLVLAGGEYSGFNGQVDVEYNLNHWTVHQPSVAHSFNVLRNWPGTIVQLEYSLGYKVLLRSPAVRRLPENHILRQAYFFKSGDVYFWHVADGNGSFHMRSWDMLAVLAAAGNAGKNFPAITKRSNRGTIVPVASSRGGVKTIFNQDIKGKHLRTGLAAADYGLTQDGPGNEITQQLERQITRVLTRPIKIGRNRTR